MGRRSSFFLQGDGSHLPTMILNPYNIPFMENIRFADPLEIMRKHVVPQHMNKDTFNTFLSNMNPVRNTIIIPDLERIMNAVVIKTMTLKTNSVPYLRIPSLKYINSLSEYDKKNMERWIKILHERNESNIKDNSNGQSFNVSNMTSDLSSSYKMISQDITWECSWLRKIPVKDIENFVGLTSFKILFWFFFRMNLLFSIVSPEYDNITKKAALMCIPPIGYLATLLQQSVNVMVEIELLFIEYNENPQQLYLTKELCDKCALFITRNMNIICNIKERLYYV